MANIAVRLVDKLLSCNDYYEKIIEKIITKWNIWAKNYSKQLIITGIQTSPRTGNSAIIICCTPMVNNMYNKLSGYYQCALQSNYYNNAYTYYILVIKSYQDEG